MKFEYVLDKFIALGPKVYGGRFPDGREFTKVKGFKEEVSLDTLEALLDQNPVIPEELKHSKWFRDIEAGSIKETESEYALRPTNTKRELVYENGKLVSTQNKVIKLD